MNKSMPCKFYKAGNCNQGEFCKFSHYSQQTQLISQNNKTQQNQDKPDREQKICAQFASGKICKYGAKCRNLHQTLDEYEYNNNQAGKVISNKNEDLSNIVSFKNQNEENNKLNNNKPRNLTKFINLQQLGQEIFDQNAKFWGGNYEILIEDEDEIQELKQKLNQQNFQSYLKQHQNDKIAIEIAQIIRKFQSSFQWVHKDKIFNVKYVPNFKVEDLNLLFDIKEGCFLIEVDAEQFYQDQQKYEKSRIFKIINKSIPENFKILLENKFQEQYIKLNFSLLNAFKNIDKYFDKIVDEINSRFKDESWMNQIIKQNSSQKEEEQKINEKIQIQKQSQVQQKIKQQQTNEQNQKQQDDVKKQQKDQNLTKQSQEQDISQEEIELEANWNQELQNQLENAILKYKQIKDPIEKWQLISEQIPGKNQKQCLARFKYCAKLAKQKKLVTTFMDYTNFLVSEEEALNYIKQANEDFEKAINKFYEDQDKKSQIKVDQIKEKKQQQIKSQQNDQEDWDLNQPNDDDSDDDDENGIDNYNGYVQDEDDYNKENNSEQILESYNVNLYTKVMCYGENMKNTVGAFRVENLELLGKCKFCNYKTKLTLVHKPEHVEQNVNNILINQVPCLNCKKQGNIVMQSEVAHQTQLCIGKLGSFLWDIQDILFIDLQVTCNSCTNEQLMINIMSGLKVVQNCQTCFKQIQIQFTSIGVENIIIESQDNGGGKKGVGSKQQKKQIQQEGEIVQKKKKIGTFTVGQPLPKNGTCKHYSKSFRYFRFPCCGKAFACDDCHNEVEKHEMIMAKGMICGYCSSEQAIKETCSRCGSSMCRFTSKQGHWEGGKGNRNQATMSTKDPKKYAGIGKTVSKKQQQKKQ